MALSNDLISEFVKATMDKSEPAKESTAYGKIVVKDGKEYVQLDGSDLLTPISTTTVVKEEDRVMVTIKNHTAIVTGDLTNPSASNKDVTEIGNKISEFEIVIADKVTTEQLEAEVARIEKLRTEELEATNAKIETLEGKVAKIDKIEADVIEVSGKISATEAEFDTLRADIADFKDVTAERVDAVEGNFNNLSSDYAKFEETVTTRLEAAEADIKDLDTEKLDAETAKITYATIDFANINEAAVEKLFSDSGIIKDLIMSDGKVTGELVGVTIKGDIIEGNTVKADKLVILGEDGLYYKLNVDALGETTASSDDKYQNGLDGSVIIAESITAEKIAVDDLVAFGATIGGFKINNHAIYSGVKNSIKNTTTGIYLGDDGQVNIGDQNNFLKYYIDENGKYRLEIQADSLRFGSSNTTIEEYIQNNVEIAAPEAIKTVEGTELVINDGKQIIDFNIYGKSEQSPIYPVQLIDIPYNEVNKTWRGITYTLKPDNSITVKGTCTEDTSFMALNGGYAAGKYPIPEYLIPGETYTISGGIYGVGVALYLYRTDGTGKTFVSYTNPATFVMPAGYTYYGIFLQVGLGVTVDGIVHPMLNKGSSALPFTDGYLKSKNIVPTDFADWESGQYALEDGNKVTTATRIRVKRLIKVCPNTVYYAKTDSYNFVLREYDNSTAYCKSTGGLASSDGCTFTTSANTYYIGISLYEGTDYATFQSKWNEVKPFICLNSEPNKTYSAYSRSIRHSKNLFDYITTLRKSVNGLTNTINPDGSITVSGIPTGDYTSIVPTGNIDDLLEDGQQYTISQSIDTYSRVYLEVRAKNISTGNYVYYTIQHGVNHKTFTVDKSTYSYDIYIVTGKVSNWGTSSQTITCSYQLEKGSTATSFEKYGVTPSPEFPSEIVSLGYENLFKPTLVGNDGVGIMRARCSVEIDGDVFKVTATGSDAYVGEVTSTVGTAYTGVRGYLMDVTGATCISYKLSNPKFEKNYITAYDENLKSIKTNEKRSHEDVHVLPAGTKYISFRFGASKSVAGETYETTVQINTGPIIHQHIPFGKYGYEIVHSGKNYFNASLIPSSIGIVVSDNGKTIKMPLQTSGGGYTGTSKRLRELAPNLKVGDVVWLNFTRNLGYSYNNLIYLQEANSAWTNGASRTITQKDLDSIVVLYANSYDSGETGQVILTDLRITKNVDDEFESYRGNKILFTLDEPLRSTNNVIRDVARIQNGVLRVERKLGGVKFDGTEPWGFAGIGKLDQRFDLKLSDIGITNIASGKRYSSHFIVEGTNSNPWGYYYMSPEWLVINNNDNAIKTLADFKSWVAANKPEFVYNLATPIIEEIGPVYVPISEGKLNTYYVTDPIVPDLYCKYGTIYAGLDGQSIYSVTDEFYVSTSKITLTGGSWSDETPSWKAGKYLWTRSKIIYSNPTATEYTKPVCDSSWEAINDIEVGGRNYIRSSRDFTRDADRAKGWVNSGNYTFTKEGDFTIASISKSGLAESSYFSLYTNLIDINVVKDKTVCISFDIKVDDVDAWDVQIPFIWEYDNGNRTRVGWRDMRLSDNTFNIHELQSGVWTRLVCIIPPDIEMGYSPGNSFDNVAYAGFRFCLFKNGSVHYRKAKLELGNTVTDWTPAPEDIEAELSDTSTQIYNKITEVSADILIDAGEIVQEATKSLVTQTEFGEYKETAKTEMKTTSEGVFIELNETHNGQKFSDLDGDIKKINEKLNKNFSFTQDGMIIGSGDSAVKLIIDNENGIIFERKDGYRLGYWDGNDFYAGNIVIRVDERAQFGNYAYIPKSDGSLMFTRVK